MRTVYDFIVGFVISAMITLFFADILYIILLLFAPVLSFLGVDFRLSIAYLVLVAAVQPINYKIMMRYYD